MPRTERVTLPLMPLPRGSVLLPGVVQRIIASSERPDIASLLATVYTRAASKSPAGRIDSVPIACVPFASPLLGRDGQLLLPNGGESDDVDAVHSHLARVKKGSLYRWGVAAKITGIEGRGSGEFTVLVEGVGRVCVERIYSDKPYMEGKVVYHEDEIFLPDPVLEDLFQHLQILSREVVALLRLTSVFTRSNGRGGLDQMLANRLRIFIGKKKTVEAGSLADFMTNIVESSYEKKLQVLGLLDVKKRVAMVTQLVEGQIANIKKNFKITTFTRSDTLPIDTESEKDMPSPWKFNRPKGLIRMPATSMGLPSSAAPGPRDKQAEDDEPDDVEELQKRLDAAKLSPEAAKVAKKEMNRLRKIPPQQAEHAVIRSYLETLAEIPWSVTTDDRLGRETLTRARKQLDDDHYGLDKVKKRLLEYLAVLRLKQSINEDLDAQIKQVQDQMGVSEADAKESRSATTAGSALEDTRKANAAKLEALKSRRQVDKSPILLLAGPPGVGKTSLARSVASALGRKFHRISLGGVRDEAEIRGHRRTYVAAMPGLVVHGLKKVGVANPVFLLDEIDKLGGANFHGDPSAAMLEVLDPEQNYTFNDHYVNIPIDLSRVLFIATANSLDPIPRPLLDRLETIHLEGYTAHEKQKIAMQHLIPKQIRVNGLTDDQAHFSPEVVSKIIDSYTRESGVRSLEREIGSVIRAKTDARPEAVQFADAKDSGLPGRYSPAITMEDLGNILGTEKFEAEIAEQTSRPGVVTGLVAYSSGGDGSILFIEVADMPGSGSVQLTGKLGDVLKESVEVALTWVKAHAFDLGLTTDSTENIMKHRSIHVHCPAGAIPKDGPSSGVGQAIALISLFSSKAVPPTMAMTGEISLRGRVTAVGGIKEKLIGALRAGVKTVLLPAQNRKDVKDLPPEVKDGLEIIHVSHIWEAIRHVWPDAHFPGEQDVPGLESRL